MAMSHTLVLLHEICSAPVTVLIIHIPDFQSPNYSLRVDIMLNAYWHRIEYHIKIMDSIRI